MSQPRYAQAIALAARAHIDQFRWGGQPFVTHCIRVAEAVAHLGESYAIVGVLHDVLEDCADASVDSVGIYVAGSLVLPLRPVELDALVALTRLDGMPYLAYIDQLLASSNGIAVAVKTADLEDNLPGFDALSLGYRERAEALHLLRHARGAFMP